MNVVLSDRILDDSVAFTFRIIRLPEVTTQYVSMTLLIVIQPASTSTTLSHLVCFLLNEKKSACSSI